MTEPIEGAPAAPAAEPAGDSFSAEQWTERFNEGGWFETLSEDVSKDPSMTKFVGKPHSEVAKSYIQLQKAFGDKIPRSKESFTKKEWDEYNREYTPGYPEDATGYNLQRPEGAPEKYQVSDEERTKFSERAHDLGMSTSQTERWWNAEQAERIEQYNNNMQQFTEQVKTDDASLKKEWGSAYQERMNIVNAVAQKFAPPELMEQIGKQYINSGVKKMLYNIGQNFKEGTIERQGKASGVLDPVAATNKAHSLQEKAANAARKGRRREADELTMEARKYFEMATQGQ